MRQNPFNRYLPLLLIGLGAAVVLSVAVQLYVSRRSAAGFPRVGARLADFTLNDLSGRAVKLSDYAGQTVLINAWASWCPPCAAEMPLLVAEHQARKERQFTVLAINAGETRAEAAAFAAEYAMPFPVLLDPDAALLDSFLIDSLPTTLVVGPDRVVKAVHVGILDAEVFAAEIAPFLP